MVVVHDLASRYPVAKLVKSTKADQVVLPILDQDYDVYGNPRVQISKKMQEMAKKRALMVL